TSEPTTVRITVHQLPTHHGACDSEPSFDPMFADQRIARATGNPGPQTCEAVVRYMWTLPLDFDPGSKFAYANFGYCLLGRIIERASLQPYKQRVFASVLAPANVTRMRLGRGPLADRAEGEVRYYNY